MKIISDDSLSETFKNLMHQTDNTNRDAEIFILGDEIYKIYAYDDKKIKFNLNVLKRVFKNYDVLKHVEELVLPNDLISYNNHVVGYSMDLIKGDTLECLINNNQISQDSVKKIFKEVLNMLYIIKGLPVDLVIGDLHERNILVDSSLNVKIIDCDSFIIKNYKLKVNNEILVGKYINSYFDQKELKKVDSYHDQVSLLVMILRYVFKDVLGDEVNPIKCIYNNEEYSEIKKIIDPVLKSKNLVLSESHIDILFRYIGKFKKNQKNDELIRLEQTRIRKML